MSQIIILLLLAQSRIFPSTPITELDEKHDYTRVSSMNSGKRLFAAGICTIIAGEVVVYFLGRISSTNIYGTKSSTYFAPYNYPFVLGGSLIAVGTKKMTDYVCTAKDNKFKPNTATLPVYITATALDVAGVILLCAGAKDGKTAAILPVEISAGAAPGILVCTTGSVLHIFNTIQYLLENRKIRNEVTFRILPAVDPTTMRPIIRLSFSLGL
jgi:hypothetical protein